MFVVFNILLYGLKQVPHLWFFQFSEAIYNISSWHSRKHYFNEIHRGHTLFQFFQFSEDIDYCLLFFHQISYTVVSGFFSLARPYTISSKFFSWVHLITFICWWHDQYWQIIMAFKTTTVSSCKIWPEGLGISLIFSRHRRLTFTKGILSYSARI